MTALPAGEAAPRGGIRVLHGCPLRPGTRIENTSLYEDPVWRLGPAMLQAHQRPRNLDFTKVPAPYEGTARELCYAMLSGPMPSGETRTGIQSVLGVFAEICRFFSWLDSRPAGTSRSLEALAGHDLEDYQRHLLISLPDKPITRTRARGALRRLWRWREQLPSGHLSFDPGHLDGWGETHSKRGENSTSRIPEDVMGALLTWALRFTDLFADDIIAAYHHRLQAPRLRKPRPAGPRTMDIEKRLCRLLDDRAAAGQPVPGYRGQPNYKEIARLLSCDPLALRRYRGRIEAAASATGISSGPLLGVPVTASLDGAPWLGAITADNASYDGISRLSRMLVASAYYLIAYLSGMRDSEIKHLRRGCLRTERDEHGRPYRWKVSSLAFKGEADREGAPATWCVGEPAARAITVLEALQPAGTSLLFTVLGDRRQPGRQGTALGALSTTETNRYLNELITWIRGYCAATGRCGTVPDAGGSPWHLQSRQLRRTLAWYIARRPGGVIAGALAYRHHSIQMFEGYAGTSDSGFRAEVESEQALARGEHYLAMIDAHEHDTLAGPAAAEAAERLASFAGQARFQGQVVLDERRLKRIMKRDDPAVYPGKFVTCVHDHAKALCAKAQRGRAEQLPDHGGCKPLACRNVALTPENLQTWRAEASRIDTRLSGTVPLPPLLEHQLRHRREAVTAFLDRHDPAGQS